MGMDVYGRDGSYFRANIWSWRAICHALELAGFEVPPSWGYSVGAGLASQAECDRLADTLEAFLEAWDGGSVTLECKDVRVDDSGAIVEPGTPGSHSPYRATREHIAEFADFLRDCGGFEIR